MVERIYLVSFSSLLYIQQLGIFFFYKFSKISNNPDRISKHLFDCVFVCDAFCSSSLFIIKMKTLPDEINISIYINAYESIMHFNSIRVVHIFDLMV